jgi:hypothetical protein
MHTMIKEAIRAPLESIGEFEDNGERVKVADPVSKLKGKLVTSLSEQNDHDRLETWTSEQVNAGKLEILTEDATAFKKVFTSKDAPNIVFKAFFESSREAWQEEANQDIILRKYIASHFLPETEYVELKDSNDPDKQFFVIQEREYGVQLKAFVSRVIASLHAEMSIEYVGDYFDENPAEWSILKRMALIRFIPSTMWAIAVGEARILAEQMTKLEEIYKISDLDFFITPEGKIKIIDFELVKKEDFEPIEGGYLEGLADFKAIFKV